jgi:hypothetical protein
VFIYTGFVVAPICAEPLFLSVESIIKELKGITFHDP